MSTSPTVYRSLFWIEDTLHDGLSRANMLPHSYAVEWILATIMESCDLQLIITGIHIFFLFIFTNWFYISLDNTQGSASTLALTYEVIMRGHRTGSLRCHGTTTPGLLVGAGSSRGRWNSVGCWAWSSSLEFSVWRYMKEAFCQIPGQNQTHSSEVWPLPSLVHPMRVLECMSFFWTEPTETNWLEQTLAFPLVREAKHSESREDLHLISRLVWVT